MGVWCLSTFGFSPCWFAEDGLFCQSCAADVGDTLNSMGVFPYAIVTWFGCSHYFKIFYLSMLGFYWYYSFNSNIGYSRHCLKAYFFAFVKERFGLGKRIRKSNPSFPFSNLSIFQPQISTWKGFNNFKLDFGMSDDSNSLCTQITTEELIIVSGLCDALM